MVPKERHGRGSRAGHVGDCADHAHGLIAHERPDSRLRATRRASLTIAIDAPTIVPNDIGQRPCERTLQQMFGKQNAGPYPANRRRLSTCNGGVPRGCELSELFQKDLGAIEGLLDVRHSGVSVLEVFPAPATVRLFNLPKAIAYKKKKGRSWESCREGLSSYLSHLQQLDDPALILEVPLAVRDEKGVALKKIEDQTDAMICAYIAGLAWLYGPARIEMIGNLEDGYVVVPTVMPRHAADVALTV